MAASKKPRMTLAERRRQALDQLEEPAPAQSESPAPAPDPPRKPAERERPPAAKATEAAPARPARGKRKTTAEIAREKGKVPLGLYFPNVADLDEARRAFVTDFWEHDGPDTFSEWISQAILTHAARTTSQRAALAQPRRSRRTGVKGKLRKIDVRREISEAVDKGLGEDRAQLRRQITISTWCNDAVLAAIAATKDRTEGDLMEIDGPLPPRLRR